LEKNDLRRIIMSEQTSVDVVKLIHCIEELKNV